MAVFKRNHLFRTIILGIHVSFRGVYPPFSFKVFLFVATSYSKTNLQTTRNTTVPPPGHQINGVQPSSFFDSWHEEAGNFLTAHLSETGGFANTPVGHINFKHLLSRKNSHAKMPH